MYATGQLIAIASYSTALLAAVYWTFFLLTDVLQAPEKGRDQLLIRPGVASLEVYVPPNRKDDLYQNVNLILDGQEISLKVDTSFPDTFVVSSECDAADPESGCYNVERPYSINENTKIIPNGKFLAGVGGGRAIGKKSSLNVGLQDLAASTVTIGIIYNATGNEFQNGSYAGLLGLGIREVSAQWFKQIPLFDTLVSQGILKLPLFSLSSPRYGDPEQETGMLTLGEIEKQYASLDIAYGDIIPFSRSPQNLDHLSYIGWTAELEGISLNGIEVNVSTGRVRADRKHVSVLDTGASYIYLNNRDFYTIVPLFLGPTEIQPDPTPDKFTGDTLFFQCDQAQFLEMKLHGKWFPVDPLDLIEINQEKILDGIKMCRSSLRTWNMPMPVFGDSLMGLPFLRSVFAVFDYVTEDVHSKQPRLGLASTVDSEAALRRYGDLYMNRLS